MGIPNESKDVFRLLAAKQIISLPLAENLQKMIGFRNMVVHEYQRINIDIVVAVIETGLDDLIDFCDIILSLHKNILPNI